jgi:spore germination protein GerM
VKVEEHASRPQIFPARRAPSGVLVRILVFSAVLGTGLWLRTLQPMNLAAGLAGWSPWTTTAIVTLYFADGQFLFPVSRRMPATDELPRAALEALLAGPSAASGLTNPIPPGVEIRSVSVAGRVAHVDLSRAFLDGQRDVRDAVTAVVGTMTRLPGITSVVLSVDGKPIGDSTSRVPLLYYPSPKGLVAAPAPATQPRAALAAYLSGPPAAELTGVPSDVRLLAYNFDAATGVLSLGFTYTPSIRTLALETPDRMRFLLLGLIASLTEFPEVRAVQLDFGGQSRLGLGECSDLLRTPQPRPALLNDERLLAW